jgi:hypothetical protein
MVYNTLAKTAQKTSLIFSSSIFAVGTYLFAKPLLSNGCSIFAYLVVVAQQQVYML